MKFTRALSQLLTVVSVIAPASSFAGYKCGNLEAFNDFSIHAEIEFGADDRATAEVKDDGSQVVTLKQANSVNPNGLYVFTADGAHPLRNTEAGAIVTIDANNAGYIAYRGKTVAISCSITLP